MLLSLLLLRWQPTQPRSRTSCVQSSTAVPRSPPHCFLSPPTALSLSAAPSSVSPLLLSPVSLQPTTGSLSARPAFVHITHTPFGQTTLRKHTHTHRTPQDLAGPLTVRRRTATGGVWEAAVGTDGAVELAAGDILEAADGTAVCALLVCPARLPDTAAEQTDLSIAEKLAVCAPLLPLFLFLCVCVTPCWHRRQRSSTASCSGRCWSWSSVLLSRRRVCAAPSLVFFFLLTEPPGCPHRDAEGAGEARGRGLRRSAKAQARSSSCCLVNISHPFHFFLSKQKNKKSTH